MTERRFLAAGCFLGFRLVLSAVSVPEARLFFVSAGLRRAEVFLVREPGFFDFSAILPI